MHSCGKLHRRFPKRLCSSAYGALQNNMIMIMKVAWATLYNISATIEASNFKFGTQLSTSTDVSLICCEHRTFNQKANYFLIHRLSLPLAILPEIFMQIDGTLTRWSDNYASPCRLTGGIMFLTAPFSVTRLSEDDIVKKMNQF